MSETVFEQSGKPVRVGSEVGIDYGADVDFGTVVMADEGHVHIRLRGTTRIVIHSSEELFPVEEQDEDPIWSEVAPTMVRQARINQMDYRS